MPSRLWSRTWFSSCVEGWLRAGATVTIRCACIGHGTQRGSGLGLGPHPEFGSRCRPNPAMLPVTLLMSMPAQARALHLPRVIMTWNGWLDHCCPPVKAEPAFEPGRPKSEPVRVSAGAIARLLAAAVLLVSPFIQLESTLGKATAWVRAAQGGLCVSMIMEWIRHGLGHERKSN